jgi:hypothetical protein
MRKRPGYQAAAWLALCGVVFTVVALFMYPWLPTPPVPVPVSVSVDDPHQVVAVELTVKHVTKSTFELDLLIGSTYAQVDPAQPDSDSAFVDVLLLRVTPLRAGRRIRTSRRMGEASRWITFHSSMGRATASRVRSRCRCGGAFMVTAVTAPIRSSCCRRSMQT